MSLPGRPIYTVNPVPPPISPSPDMVEYVDTHAERKEFADGRVVQVKQEIVTQDSESRVAKCGLHQPYTAACTCTVGSVFELVECQSDHEIVCIRHAFTCTQCGLVHCLACGKSKDNGWICRKCAAREKKTKFLKGLFGLIWKSNDDEAK